MDGRHIAYVAGGILALGLFGWLIFHDGEKVIEREEEQQILSFADCSDAGYLVMESYPRQCRTPDGRLFAEEIPASEIEYTNATADNITIDTPTPDAVTGKEFSIIGEARGTWYFEASFPVEILDSSGKVIASGIGQATSDWMTEEFVPFKADIKIASYTGPATIVIRNDNPSGLPENARSISFPITIEY